MVRSTINEPEIEALVRIRLFEALSEADSRYKTLVERIHEVVFQYDNEWRITFLNQAWKTLLGYSINESLNKNFLDFVCAEDKHSMADYISVSSDMYKEMRLYHHDGHAIWFELSIKPDVDGSGGVGLLHSIDHHKNTQTTLREARDLAIEAMDDKSHFVANMSHEIRTPLNGVYGGLQLLLTTDMSEEQQQYVEMGLESSKLLQKITNDILDYSKLEAGQLILEECEIALVPLAKNALLITTPLNSNIQTVFSISDSVPEIIVGDPTRINQILMNLLSNAFKFTNEGRVSLAINIDSTQSDIVFRQIVFSVTDTGIGIPADRQDAIFDSFTQADPSTTRKYGGTGLGLAIVKQFVKLMNGQIFVESKTGEGSQFTVKIPLLTKNQNG